MKLKKAERKLRISFENEMTMQEMVSRQDRLRRNGAKLSHDMDVRAAEKRAEEAIKESEQLKAQLQQVQLKFRCTQTSVSAHVELSSQLEAAMRHLRHLSRRMMLPTEPH